LQLQFKLKITQVHPNNVAGELIGSAYFTLLSKICAYLKTNLILKPEFLNKMKYIFIIIVHSTASKDVIIKYFDKYPLLSDRHQNYAD
jgi:hypothetical protein